jgi:hypothetical protein
MSNLRRSHDQEWLNGVLIGAVFGFSVASFVAPEGSATGSAMAGLTVAFMCLAVAQGEVTRPRPRPARRRRPPAPPGAASRKAQRELAQRIGRAVTPRKPQPAGGRLIRSDEPPC